MVNRVILVGRLTRDPELRKTNSDLSVASFTVAVDNTRKNNDGTRGTVFMNCTIFGQQAENAVKFTRKGSLVGVDGSLNQRSFTRADGSKGSVIELIADSITFLDPKTAGGQENLKDVTFDDEPMSQVSESENLEAVDLPDDDLPF